MSSISSIIKTEFRLNDKTVVLGVSAIRLNNNIEIILVGPLKSYLELKDRIIVVLDWYRTNDIFDITRNIYCYSKNSGELLWNIESFQGSDITSRAYKYIGLCIKDLSGKCLPLSENSSEVTKHSIGNYDYVIGQIYNGEFEKGKDYLSALTLGEFPAECYVDIDTGKVTWFAKHQKI